MNLSRLEHATLEQRSCIPVVFLNTYSLSRHNRFLRFLGFPILHSGVEIYGTEYFFVGHTLPDVTGIMRSDPRIAPFPHATYQRTHVMGETELSPDEVEQVVASLSIDYLGTNYNVIRRNCNNFAQDLIYALTGRRFPRFVNRLARCVGVLGCVIDFDRFSARNMVRAPQETGPSNDVVDERLNNQI
ncbi:hypothetical protein RCL1_000250 [Eukaryota sp. TZLM3-RCL]